MQTIKKGLLHGMLAAVLSMVPLAAFGWDGGGSSDVRIVRADARFHFGVYYGRPYWYRPYYNYYPYYPTRPYFYNYYYYPYRHGYDNWS